MNRLILIGNGFDLAHGMKTSYLDFIFNYIQSSFLIAKEKNLYHDELFVIRYQASFDFQNIAFEKMSDFKIHLNDRFGRRIFADADYGEPVNKMLPPYEWSIHNSFFQKLVIECCDLNWVDIENEYYSFLLKILHDEKSNQLVKTASITELNKVFKFLINKLSEYFAKIEMPDFNPYFLDIFKEHIKKEEIVGPLLASERKLESLMILNFNYTATHEIYKNWYNEEFNNNTTSNYIHGRLKSVENPIIFGFGDETDENYKKIENDKSDGFLEFVKTFAYLKTPNYKRLLNFIDGAHYQIHILGHSCGLSDRILLKLIFEHRNCLSIKVFYHERDDRSNNFTKLTQSISRNFADNGSMREKVVDFTLSCALPQYNH